MLRNPILILVCLICGCAHSVQTISPVAPDLGTSQRSAFAESPHHLLGLYEFRFSEDHLSCDVVPQRIAGFHLNAVKLLDESPCTNCVRISNLKALGSGVIELDVTIRHPFEQPLVYSAFDVKGIIMFNGSLRPHLSKLTYYTYPELYPGYMSWALRGDWELLNPDGYSYYWSPPFNADSEWPITRYFPGRLSSGVPTANINGYMDFYTDEDRHLFRPGRAITKTYQIQTQPGPVVAGYAVDACWHGPDVCPVLDPLTDFPPTANSPEPYHFEVVVNDGEPVIEDDWFMDARRGRIKMFIEQWNGLTVTKTDSLVFYQVEGVLGEDKPHDFLNPEGDAEFVPCYEPCGDNCYCGIGRFTLTGCPEGWYRLVTMTYWGESGYYYDIAVDATDFYYDPP